MTIFRWIMGVLGGIFAAFWALSFLLYVLRDDDRLKELGSRMRQYTILVALTWFNIEVWGRVVWTIVTWGKPAD